MLSPGALGTQRADWVFDSSPFQLSLSASVPVEIDLVKGLSRWETKNERSGPHRRGEMQHERSNSMQKLFGVLICVCLLVQPVLVSLHFLCADHTYGHTDRTVDVAAHDRDGNDPDSHPLYPVEDHDRQAPELASPPTSDIGPLAIPPRFAAISWGVQPSATLSGLAPRVSERSPPRASAQPRAPPSVV